MMVTRSGLGAPTWSLKTQHIVTRDVQERLNLIFRGDDVQGLQQMISRGEIFIDSTTPYGVSLLWVNAINA
jgi:hypothetical protein